MGTLQFNLYNRNKSTWSNYVELMRGSHSNERLHLASQRQRFVVSNLDYASVYCEAIE